MSVFNLMQYFEHSNSQKYHLQKIKKAKPAIDSSRPKTKLQCTKQPLSEFNKMLLMQLQNKSLMKKLSNLQSSIDQNGAQIRITTRNNRKQYYQEHQIRTQNQGLLKRIRSAKTSYSRKRLSSQRKSNQKYLSFLCKFGFKGKSNTHFRYNTNVIQRQLTRIDPNTNMMVVDKVNTCRNQNELINKSSYKKSLRFPTNSVKKMCSSEKLTQNDKQKNKYISRYKDMALQNNDLTEKAPFKFSTKCKNKSIKYSNKNISEITAIMDYSTLQKQKTN